MRRLVGPMLWEHADGREHRVRGDDVGGMAVHLVTRIMAAADAGEILVLTTVKDLVVGSDLSFEDRGMHRLKGIQGDWQLLSRCGVPIRSYGG
jgi:class 3 adenylate cyclase